MRRFSILVKTGSAAGLQFDKETMLFVSDEVHVGQAVGQVYDAGVETVAFYRCLCPRGGGAASPVPTTGTFDAPGFGIASRSAQARTAIGINLA